VVKALDFPYQVILCESLVMLARVSGQNCTSLQISSSFLWSELFKGTTLKGVLIFYYANPVPRLF